jgi:hypothetical protein
LKESPACGIGYLYGMNRFSVEGKKIALPILPAHG